MKDTIKNELLDLLDSNEIIFVEKENNSMLFLHTKLGSCTYWVNKDKVHIHKGNKWENNGFYFLKNSFK